MPQSSGASCDSYQNTITHPSGMFPGLGIATVAFGAYVIWDDYIRVKPAHHH